MKENLEDSNRNRSSKDKYEKKLGSYGGILRVNDDYDTHLVDNYGVKGTIFWDITPCSSLIVSEEHIVSIFSVEQAERNPIVKVYANRNVG
jgi:hypothetical protein